MKLEQLIEKAMAMNASDLFIVAGTSVSLKVNNELIQLDEEKLLPEHTKALIEEIFTLAKRSTDKLNLTGDDDFSFALAKVARFRVNVYTQRSSLAAVLRIVKFDIPTPSELHVPESIMRFAKLSKGLVLLSGPAGCGKSTTMAAMIDHRNTSAPGHVITVEDPVEYVHTSKQCLVTHREVGVDTHSWHNALKNTLRQAPDVILIGEIRDLETMEHALAFAETGHLCMGTLHANNANQTLDRVVNFFPDERKPQVMMDLASNLKAVISQRLVRSMDGKRKAAIEILLNTPTIAELLSKGQSAAIKPVMDKSRELGMQTFDQALFDLYDAGVISYEESIRNADSTNELRLAIKLKSKKGEPSTASAMSLSMEEKEPEPEEEGKPAS